MSRDRDTGRIAFCRTESIGARSWFSTRFRDEPERPMGASERLIVDNCLTLCNSFNQPLAHNGSWASSFESVR
jgi:hypothetical protein